MEEFTLKDGIRCTFEQREGSGVVAVQVWVKAGSKYENAKEAGITHFIEHLIFKGSEKLSSNEIAVRIEALGGSINAFTSYDNTVYYIVIPSSAFQEGTRLLLEAVMHPAFPEAEVAKEKQVVLEEIKMGEDDPQRKLFRELFLLSYEGHPYGRPVIGYTETVKKIQRDDILSYYRSHYTPDSMIIVITGDFDRKAALDLIGEYGAQPEGKQTFTKKTNNEKQTRGKKQIIERDVRESYLAMSYPIPPLVNNDTPALEILGAILGTGESSRLWEQLRYKQGIVNNIATYLFVPKEEGLFIVYATFKGNDSSNVLTRIDGEIVRLLREGPTPWEMEKAKNIIKASYIYSAETVQGRAHEIGNFQMLTNDPAYVRKFLDQVDKVTVKDVATVLQKYIIGKEPNLVVLLPKKVSNPHTLKLSNGLACVTNVNKASPSFAFRIGFVGGLKEEQKGKNGAYSILSRMLLKGTKTKDSTAIAREIDMLAGGVSPFSGKNTFGLSGKFLSADKKKVLALLSEILTETVLTESELKKVKEEVLSDIRQRDDDPTGFTFRQFNETLFEGHPYGMDPLGTEQDIKSITLEDIKALYRKSVSPDGAILAVSGDFDEKELVSIIKEMFSSWQGCPNSITSVPLKPRAAKVRHIHKEIMQSHLIFGFVGPGITDSDKYAVEVMDAILSGMGGRIHRVLREENPYAYALTFFNHMNYENGSLGIYIGTDKTYTAKVIDIAKAEIKKILEKGFTEKEVEDAKNYLIGNHLISMQSNGTIAANMCLDTIYGLGPGYFKVWPGHIAKVTLEDVNKAARKYLPLDRMVELSVGPVE